MFGFRKEKHVNALELLLILQRLRNSMTGFKNQFCKDHNEIMVLL